MLPPGTLVISESGMHDPEDAARLFANGARGFLIGEALMRSEDPAEFIARFKSAAVSPSITT
jgi:indole-3-glycerol phosphate synthase